MDQKNREKNTLTHKTLVSHVLINLVIIMM